MMVCAHGDVVEYCAERDMQICDVCEGDLRNYRGPCRVLVTDSEMSESEYYFTKGEMLAKGIELISTRHKDNGVLSAYLVYETGRRRVRRGGREVFGDKVVIARILELRSLGKSMRVIRDDEAVRNKDGSKLSLSTISKIIEREKKDE